MTDKDRTSPETERTPVISLADRIHDACPHNLGHDHETGPNGCNLVASGFECVCEHVHMHALRVHAEADKARTSPVSRLAWRCPHDMGFDNEIGPLGCRLVGQELECVCEALAARPDHAQSPDYRQTLENARQEIVLAIAFLGRDIATKRLDITAQQLCTRLANADAAIRSTLAGPDTSTLRAPTIDDVTSCGQENDYRRASASTDKSPKCICDTDHPLFKERGHHPHCPVSSPVCTSGEGK